MSIQRRIEGLEAVAAAKCPTLDLSRLTPAERDRHAAIGARCGGHPEMLTVSEMRELLAIYDRIEGRP